MTRHDPNQRESVQLCRLRMEECEVFPKHFSGFLYDLFLQLHNHGTTPDDKIGIICQVSWFDKGLQVVCSVNLGAADIYIRPDDVLVVAFLCM